ncbi:MAG TPA: HutD family protein [Steroidobacteraceae bacterium]|nr:HutD family protein [Steroidobacteraceae bacterium]
MRIIRQSAFVSVPWKNGGGVTREAIRMPPSGASFHWRLSIAQIDKSGPFSDFAAYRRFMVLLKGGGVRLEIASPHDPEGASERRELRAGGDWVQFDGALATNCELIDGPCVDLNLMVSKASPAPSVRVERVREPLCPRVEGSEWMLAFPLDSALELRGGTGAHLLDPWDVALWSGQDDPSVRIAPVPGGESAAGAKVLLATLAGWASA